MMKSLLYLSRNLSFNRDGELERLIPQIQKRNARLSVSGYLYTDQDYFLQYLEGDEAVLDRLWFKICQDDRHEIMYMTTTDIDELRFPDWSMKFFCNSTQVEVLLYKYLIEQMQFMASKSLKSRVLSFFGQDLNIWKMVDHIRLVTNPFAQHA
ncbi:MAG TPA: hypothetical protein DHW71_03550 [Gammaproteobacteria bacterium]|nr:hypothetical protein [Gammaproteobacteria bacterium]HCK92034.1 hypothetical protein [Gammaproteobacteria bacterium]|tara:strand:+ start:1497 stop:1955 length:459 start_codon:yes stop_codon:yes gene_type:complete